MCSTAVLVVSKAPSQHAGRMTERRSRAHHWQRGDVARVSRTSRVRVHHEALFFAFFWSTMTVSKSTRFVSRAMRVAADASC